MVSPDRITNATLENIDSLLILAQAQYRRAKTARQAYGSKSTLYAINDATNQLNLVTQKKQELLAKKKLVMI